MLIMESVGGGGGIQAVTFSTTIKILNIWWHFVVYLRQDHTCEKFKLLHVVLSEKNYRYMHLGKLVLVWQKSSPHLGTRENFIH